MKEIRWTASDEETELLKSFFVDKSPTSCTEAKSSSCLDFRHSSTSGSVLPSFDKNPERSKKLKGSKDVDGEESAKSHYPFFDEKAFDRYLNERARFEIEVTTLEEMFAIPAAKVKSERVNGIEQYTTIII